MKKPKSSIAIERGCYEDALSRINDEIRLLTFSKGRIAAATAFEFEDGKFRRFTA